MIGFGGNDYFASDDNSAITTLDGGAGVDTFQIGQIFGSKRDQAQGAAADARCFPGARRHHARLAQPRHPRALVVQGGTGNDEFAVFSNQAELRLEGDDDNDLFIVRAFALAAVVDTDANSDGLLDAADLDHPTIDNNGDGLINAADAHITDRARRMGRRQHHLRPHRR